LKLEISMPEFPHLTRALTPVLSWMKGGALPFWGTVGVDDVRGGFHERLDQDGFPAVDVPKRLMVQGRQLYVYSSASILGWYPDGRRLADRCVTYMLDSFYRADGEAGWVHSLEPDGGIANAARDLYAHAFALLGLASYHRLTGDTKVLDVADATLGYLDAAGRSACGGYLDALPPPDAIRRQNPHMHLFEALIALHHATGRRHYLARAAGLFEVFSAYFFRAQSGTLCEYLTDKLQPLPGAAGRICEPGHHYEWVWLLRQFQRASGQGVEAYCDALYQHANRHGWDRHGFIIDQVDVSGAPIKRSRRTWAHAEGLKANLAEAEAGRSGCDEEAVRCLSRLHDTFLGRPVPGGWVDHVDENGNPLVDFIPASTLYHVFCALAEASRVALVANDKPA
jgi:mannose-6-phosphate isomerase